jgi:hypothetical protein
MASKESRPSNDPLVVGAAGDLGLGLLVGTVGIER